MWYFRGTPTHGHMPEEESVLYSLLTHEYQTDVELYHAYLQRIGSVGSPEDVATYKKACMWLYQKYLADVCWSAYAHHGNHVFSTACGYPHKIKLI